MISFKHKAWCFMSRIRAAERALQGLECRIFWAFAVSCHSRSESQEYQEPIKGLVLKGPISVDGPQQWYLNDVLLKRMWKQIGWNILDREVWNRHPGIYVSESPQAERTKCKQKNVWPPKKAHGNTDHFEDNEQDSPESRQPGWHHRVRNVRWHRRLHRVGPRASRHLGQHPAFLTHLPGAKEK